MRDYLFQIVEVIVFWGAVLGVFLGVTYLRIKWSERSGSRSKRSTKLFDGQKVWSAKNLRKSRSAASTKSSLSAEQDERDQADPPWVTPRLIHQTRNGWAFATLMQRLTLVRDEWDGAYYYFALARDDETGQLWSYSIDDERSGAVLSPSDSQHIDNETAGE